MGEMLRSAMVVAVIGCYLHVVTDGFTDILAVLPKMIKLVVRKFLLSPVAVIRRC